MKLLVNATMLVTMLAMTSCGGSDAAPAKKAEAPSPDPHLLQSQADALQSAKDAAKSLEAAGRRTESEIEKNSKE